MCFHIKQTATARELKNRYKATFKSEANYQEATHINGFEHPHIPIITDTKSDEIQLFQWGLIPTWSKDTSIQKLTLNAKLETIHEKPAFKEVTNKRCLIPVTGFYEWKWLDSKGKEKEKYEIHLTETPIFSLAGLWNSWENKTNGNWQHTFTILTTEANELMAEIHNSKKRMPYILDAKEERRWLNGEMPNCSQALSAISLEPPKQMSLF